MIARKDNKPIQWPLPTHGKANSGLKPYKTAADIIDWSIPVRSIFNRKRPLAEKTLIRIAKGLEKYVFIDNPFLVEKQNQTPFITEFANASNQRNMAATEPLRTICAGVKRGHFALVTSSMIKFRGGNIGHPTTEPVHTISAGGLHIGEVRAFLVKYYGTATATRLDRPLQTITTKHRFGLVTIKGEDYQIVDIGLRMLEPHELFAAQGFPSNYIISHDHQGNKFTKASQVARCGNSVSPVIPRALVWANTGSLDCEKVA